MSKNIYKIHLFDDRFRCDPNIYIEAENLKDALLKYIMENHDFSQNDLFVDCFKIEQLKIENRKPPVKNMKNRTVLK